MKTKDLFLRPVEPEDLDLLYSWENDTALMQYGSVHLPYSRFLMKKYIELAHEDLYDARQFRWMIDSTEDAAVVGHIDLYDFDPADMRAAVAVAIEDRWQGRGWAAQALKCVAQYCAEQYLMHQLYAYVTEENEASRALFKKCGFLETSALRSWKRVRGGFMDVFVYQKILD